MTEQIEAYSPDTDKHYASFDELVAAEASGYVVIGTSDRKGTGAIVIGPYNTKAEAEAARSRLRPKWKREERPYKIHTSVRICWKERT